MQNKFADAWKVDLENDGYHCGDAQAQATLQAKIDALKLNQQENKGLGSLEAPIFIAGVRARLYLLYSNVLHRLLYTVIRTLPDLDHDYLAPEHFKWATQLIASAKRCLIAEVDRWQEYRQTLALFSGGITLARWADDGPRSGLLNPSTVRDVQKDAIRALLRGLPKIRELEAADESDLDGPLRIEPSQYEALRRKVNETILDLQAKLTR